MGKYYYDTLVSSREDSSFQIGENRGAGFGKKVTTRLLPLSRSAPYEDLGPLVAIIQVVFHHPVEGSVA